MADLTNADRLRSLIGEVIPEGGTAADTLFSSLEINDLLSRNGDSVEDSLGEAWESKAAKLVTLVDNYDGEQRRFLSQAHTHAMSMAKFYAEIAGGKRVTRVHKIVRPGFQG